MYPVVECLVIVASIIGAGTALFLVSVLVVIAKAGWSIAATNARPFASKAERWFRERLNGLSTVQSPRVHGEFER